MVMADDFESEEDFRDGVARALAECEAVGYRLGGAIVATPLRVETDSRVRGVRDFVTTGWVFQHAFAPAGKRAEPPAVDPVAAQPEVTVDEIAEPAVV
jgi:hypothetical protein